MYRQILRVAAARGYHGIGLTYPNSSTIQDICQFQTNPDCWANARNEVITGQDTSAALSVSRANSIENRLTRLLAHLDASYPAEGWGQYLPSAGLAWNLIAVAGQSQGGGHAAFLAKQRRLARAIYFASPYDYDPNRGQPASWAYQASLTPAEVQFGFSHRQDELVTWPQVQTQWSALGLVAFGAATSVDGTPAPFGNSHQIYTDYVLPGQLGLIRYHNSTVLDAATPMASDGTPVFRSAWIYLCFP
jgi:hypothetical protein